MKWVSRWFKAPSKQQLLRDLEVAEGNIRTLRLVVTSIERKRDMLLRLYLSALIKHPEIEGCTGFSLSRDSSEFKSKAIEDSVFELSDEEFIKLTKEANHE